MKISRALLLAMAGLSAWPALVSAQTGEPASRALEAMRSAAGVELAVTRSPRTQLATFVSAPNGRSIPVPDRSALTPEARALSFMGIYGRAFGLRGAEDVLVSRTERDSLGVDHVRLRQARLGIPVTGGEIVLHLRGSAVLSANGKTLGELDDVSLDPTVSSLDAQGAARRLVTERLNAASADLSEPRLEIFNQGLLNGRDFPTRLAWFVEARDLTLREFIWIDARSGMVLLHFSQLTDAKNRAVYNGNSSSALPGTPVRSEGAGATGDPDANHAYDYSGDTYDYYFANHGRDSFDGAGGQLKSTVHHCPSPAAADCPYDNAFWNGSQMVYGDGFANADDVVAHELTHAITERTANLFYYMQSGALNESFSDIFGESVDLWKSNDTSGNRWKLGEDLSIGAVRNMQNPTLLGDPGKMSDAQFKCEGSAASITYDSAGVHTNSGVPNHGYELMVDGGVYNSVSITGIGLVKAAKIQYRALTHYLTSASDFLDDYNALQQSCADLIGTAGISGGDCAEVKKALDAVQMTNVWPCSPSQAPPPPLCSAGFTPLNLFYDNFESGLGAWSVSGLAGTWARASAPLLPQQGPVAYATSGVDSMWGFDLDTAGVSSAALASNLPTIPANARLQFSHSYQFDHDSKAWDGGVLEYSTNGGGSWVDAAPKFLAGANYNGTIVPEASGNPLAARTAFVRSSWGYTASQYDLAGLAGQSSVRFRFSIGRDSVPGFVEDGWFIDDFRVYSCAPLLSIDDVSLVEGNAGTTSASFTVSLSAPSTQTVTVSAATSSTTALAGSDFTTTSVTLTFAPGVTSLPFVVPVIGDTVFESDETFGVTLSSPANAVLLKATGTGTIQNDDPSLVATPITQYRLYHNGTKEHLYTTDLNEYTVLGTQGWTQEGIAYKMLTNGLYNGVATVPLYRLYHPGILQHLWTTDANETTVLSTSGWNYEGIIGYLVPSQVSGTTPLYRMSLANPPIHLWTTDLNEYTVLQTRGWTGEGAIGYVVP